MTQQYPPPPSGQYVPPPSQHAHAVAAKKRRKWPWIVGAIVLLFVIVGVSNGDKSAPPPPRAGVPSGVDPSTFNASPPQAQAAPEAPAPAAPSGPQTTFSSGTYEVGTDIAPGKYKTKGPDGGSPLCYWARLKNTNGDLGSIIANGNPQGPAVITISKSDVAFETTGCTWTKQG